MNRRDFVATAVAGCALTACAPFDAHGRATLATAVRLLERATSNKSRTVHIDHKHLTVIPRIAAASLEVRQDGARLLSQCFGARTGPHTPFVLASISKPITAAGLMLLVDRGLLSLDEPVQKFVPEFRGGARGSVAVRQLLTHTSGLPDGFPELHPLRAEQAPFSRFLRATYEAPLLFQPGTAFQYSNLAFLLASEVAARITEIPFRRFLRTELFEPLGMLDTSLGLGGRAVSGTAQVQLPTSDINYDAVANSGYWRDIGLPWNGVHSTAADVSTFLDAFLRPDGRVLSEAAARSMVTNRTLGLFQPLRSGRLAKAMGLLSESAAKGTKSPATSWGLGWMLKSGAYGQDCSPQTFGHHGLTGTVAWADPVSGASCVLLTTRPIMDSREGILGVVSDHVAQAVSIAG